MGEEHSPESVGRVCDRCRVRKIRCDRLFPCSNCRTVQKACSLVGSTHGIRQSKQRVLISSQYEQKIDRIENRLEGIEQLLRRAFDEEPSRRSVPRPPASLPTDSLNVSQDFGDSIVNGPSHVEPEMALEGSSSMKAATVYASDFFQTVLGQSPAADTSTRVNAALSSLKQMIEINSYRSMADRMPPSRRETQNDGIRDQKMPPLQSVLMILRELKETKLATLTVVTLFISKDRLIDCCREIYFAVDNFSLPTFLIANATLRYLFQEKAQASQDPLSREEYRKLSQLCRDNLETAMNKFNVLAPPSLEKVEAFILGAIYAIEVSQPMVAWQLVSAAAGTCQTLGWHQIVPKMDSATDRKIALFWFTYLLDKGLSLRLGRPAVIHDDEITLPERFDKADVPGGWRDLLTQWIRHSRLVGRAYQDLYSPSALRKSAQERGVGVELLLVDDLEDSGLLWVEIQGAALFDKGLVHLPRVAVGILLGHGQSDGVFLHESILKTIDHRVDTQAEEMLVVGG